MTLARIVPYFRTMGIDIWTKRPVLSPCYVFYSLVNDDSQSQGYIIFQATSASLENLPAIERLLVGICQLWQLKPIAQSTDDKLIKQHQPQLTNKTAVISIFNQTICIIHPQLAMQHPANKRQLWSQIKPLLANKT